MKEFIKAFAFGLLFLLQLNLNAVEAYYNFSVFENPEGESYIETYLSVPVSSLKCVAQDEHYLTQADVVISFLQNEQVIAFDKYQLQSPQIADTNATNFSLLDLKRFKLPSGDYVLDIKVSDPNFSMYPAHFTENVNVPLVSSSSGISDILLLESFKESTADNQFQRNGFEMVPYVLNYYPNEFAQLKFYSEIYRTNEDYLLTYGIYRMGDKDVFANMRGFKKHSASKVNISMGEFNISELPSGNFELRLEARSKTNELLSQKSVFFQRNNRIKAVSIDNLDQLNWKLSFVNELSLEEVDLYLRGMEMVALQDESVTVRRILEKADENRKRAYLYNYWLQQDESYPDLAFNAFKKEVDFVQKKWTNNQYLGIETDRGQIYLKYGKPDQLDYSNFDRANYPYEIWQYYLLSTGEADVKFFFVNREIGTDQYELVHSNARGEISNPEVVKDLMDSRIDNSGQTIDFRERDNPSKERGN